MSILDEQLGLPRMTRVDDPFARRIVEAARFVTGLAVALGNDDLRRGVYYYLGTVNKEGRRITLFHEPIGIVAPAKAEKYMEFSAEKPWRAYQHQHLTSFTSRDPANNMWGGGINWADLLSGTSGHREGWDEVISTMALVLGGPLPVETALQIATSGPNPYLMSILIHLDLAAHDRV